MISFTRSRVLLGAASLVLTLAFAGPADDAQKLIKDGKYDEAIALLEKGVADAHMAKADFFLNNPQMPPMRKYPTALREYRKVLELEKSNKKAQDNIKMIEDIYKQMGREVPK